MESLERRCVGARAMEDIYSILNPWRSADAQSIRCLFETGKVFVLPARPPPAADSGHYALACVTIEY
jgi:hypothetical protein